MDENPHGSARALTKSFSACLVDSGSRQVPRIVERASFR